MLCVVASTATLYMVPQETVRHWQGAADAVLHTIGHNMVFLRLPLVVTILVPFTAAAALVCEVCYSSASGPQNKRLVLQLLIAYSMCVCLQPVLH